MFIPMCTHFSQLFPERTLERVHKDMNGMVAFSDHHGPSLGIPNKLRQALVPSVLSDLLSLCPPLNLRPSKT